MTEKVAVQLIHLGKEVSASTVCRLLKSMRFLLKSNCKFIAHANSAERNEQFEYIAHLRESYAGQGQPIISVDTKKKELVGVFKNAGRRWEREPTLVNDHDFRSQSDGTAVPYSIYEPQLNRGNVYVGPNADTPEFAESIARWWHSAKCDYAWAQRLLILADGGGSNGVRCRAWKAFFQTRLADRYRIPVTVCHYPPGTSKWNPIEHRLFSEISKNWGRQPLDSYGTIVKYIRSTKTTTGLRVRARLVKKTCGKGINISKAQFNALSLKRHDTLWQWNYTLSAR